MLGRVAAEFVSDLALRGSIRAGIRGQPPKHPLEPYFARRPPDHLYASRLFVYLYHNECIVDESQIQHS